MNGTSVMTALACLPLGAPTSSLSWKNQISRTHSMSIAAASLASPPLSETRFETPIFRGTSARLIQMTARFTGTAKARLLPAE